MVRFGSVERFAWDHEDVDSASLDPDLVPELLVSNTQASIAFWCGLCGFRFKYQSPEESFVYITRGSAHLTLEQRGVGPISAEAAAGWSIAAISAIRRECSASSLD